MQYTPYRCISALGVAVRHLFGNNGYAIGSVVDRNSNPTDITEGLDDHYTLELFYRWQMTPRLSLTGDHQHLNDPALNLDQSAVNVWTVRGRFAL
jgi:carbohydrate-selective porin OprB